MGRARIRPVAFKEVSEAKYEKHSLRRSLAILSLAFSVKFFLSVS